MDSIFRNADRYIPDVIHPLLPNANLSAFIMDQYHLLAPGQLDGSIYQQEFKEDAYFLHFTSLSSLLEIIRSKTIRISDLNSFNDPLELTYANSSLLTNTDFELDFRKLKSNLFAFSMCKCTEDNLFNEFMWNHYGKNHQGACIKLKLDRAKSGMGFFHLGKIQYSDSDEISELKELRDRHEKFQGDKIGNLDSILTIVASLYKKSSPFLNENETRLLFSPINFSNQLLSNADYPIRHRYNEDKKLIECFFELQLEPDGKNAPYGQVHFSFEKVYLGKELFGEILADLMHILKYEFKDSFNRELDLTPLFWN